MYRLNKNTVDTYLYLFKSSQNGLEKNFMSFNCEIKLMHFKLRVYFILVKLQFGNHVKVKILIATFPLGF